MVDTYQNIIESEESLQRAKEHLNDQTKLLHKIEQDYPETKFKAKLIEKTQIEIKKMEFDIKDYESKHQVNTSKKR